MNILVELGISTNIRSLLTTQPDIILQKAKPDEPKK